MNNNPPEGADIVLQNLQVPEFAVKPLLALTEYYRKPVHQVIIFSMLKLIEAHAITHKENFKDNLAPVDTRIFFYTVYPHNN